MKMVVHLDEVVVVEYRVIGQPSGFLLEKRGKVSIFKSSLEKRGNGYNGLIRNSQSKILLSIIIFYQF